MVQRHLIRCGLWSVVCSAAALLAGGCATPLADVTLTSGEKAATISPFGVVQPMPGGQTYLRVDEKLAAAEGATFSVNGGPWITAALVSRGDRVTVAILRPGGIPAARPTASLAYDVWGPTARGYVRFSQYRWYYDGFGEERRDLRTLPYGDLLGPADPA